MATLEVERDSQSLSQEELQRRDESRYPSRLEGSLIPMSIDTASIFPSVPTHDPVYDSIGSGNRGGGTNHSKMKIAAEDGDNEERRPEDRREEGGEEDEEEMEEVLEELQDDEIEEMADQRGHSYDSLTQLLGQEVDTLPLLNATQSVCMTAIQSMLRSISANPTQTVISGGKEALENVLKVCDAAVASIGSSNVHAPSSVDTRADGEQPVEKLVYQLTQVLNQPVGTETDAIEDVSLLNALKDLIFSISSARLTADELDVQLQIEQPLAISPTTSQASSISPKDLSIYTATSLSQQQARAQKALGLGRLSNAGPSSLLVGSSPSMELRNPFSDSDLRPQSSLSDDRYRERIDREMETSIRLNSMLDSLDRRCSEVISTLDMSPNKMNSNTESNQADQGHSEIAGKSRGETLKTWMHLQSLSKGARDRFANRRSHASVLPSLVDLRRGSGSPTTTTYSPSYSPSRGRSRRNSGASLSSPTSIDLGGDPTGEATAAGVGVGIGAGARRSLSRLSNNSNRGGTANAAPATIPAPASSPLTGSLVSRRGSTMSEGTGSFSVHSPPPQYSEDSLRNYSGTGWSIPQGSRESDASGTQEAKQSRRQSSGDQSAFSTRTLPAYNTNDAAYQSSIDKKGSSTSSLSKIDYSNTSLKTEEVKERSRSASDSAKMIIAPGSSATVQQGPSSEYYARTSQDLSLLQASIDRIYSVVPQMDDQRASSPLESKQRQAQKQDEMLKLIERLSKGGRMEDQRAKPPNDLSTSNRHQSVAASPEVTSFGEKTSLSGSVNDSLVKRLGSINFGSLSLKRAASILSAEGKGKEKERLSDILDDGSSTSAQPSYDDLFPLANQVQAATERGYNDQRAQIRLKQGKGSKKPSKLDLMGISTNDVLQEDDDLFDALSSSLASGRMSDQDAVKISPSYKRKSTTLSSPIRGKVSSSILSSPTTPHRLEADSENVAQASSSPTNLPVGESLTSKGNSSKIIATDASDRGLSRDDIDSSQSQYKHQAVQLSYIAESQPRLGYISVFLWAQQQQQQQQHDSKELIHYQVDPTNDKAIIITYNKLSSSFILPCSALNNQDEPHLITKERNQWQFKLQMAPLAYSNNRSNNTSAPLGASMLQKLQPSSWICNTCLIEIAQTEYIQHYLPLPSQHWEELVDAWMCHSGQELNQGMIDTQKKLQDHQGLQKDQGRVSEACVVLHESHLTANVSVDSEARRLYCHQCRSTLGQKVPSGAIKLFKYAIRPICKGAPLPPSMLSLVIANDLIRLSQAHATRHFIIEADHGGDDGDGGNAEQLHLWLFLESFDVAINSPSRLGLDSKSESVAFTACKIMYRKPQLPGTVFGRQAWSQPDLVEHIQYPIEVCQQLKHLLHQSSLFYPPIRRQFSLDWTIGFLQTAPLSM